MLFPSYIQQQAIRKTGLSCLPKYIGILNHGRLLFEGSLEDLKFTAHESGFENDNLEEMFLSMIDEDNTNRKQRLKL